MGRGKCLPTHAISARDLKNMTKALIEKRNFRKSLNRKKAGRGETWSPKRKRDYRNFRPACQSTGKAFLLHPSALPQATRPSPSGREPSTCRTTRATPSSWRPRTTSTAPGPSCPEGHLTWSTRYKLGWSDFLIQQNAKNPAWETLRTSQQAGWLLNEKDIII